MTLRGGRGQGSLRLPHTALIALTGMALGGSSAAYQGLFRNPLADPQIIGVASGAALRAVLAMAIQCPTTVLGMAVLPAVAFVGAILTVGMFYSLARVGRTTPITTLIPEGVAIGTFTSPLSSLIMLTSTKQLHRAIAWLLGGFALGGWGPVLAAPPYLSIGLAAMILLGREICDPQGIESGHKRTAGLGLLPVATVFEMRKRLVRTEALCLLPGLGGGDGSRI